MGVAPEDFAARIGVPHPALTAVMHGEQSVTTDMAILLGEAFGTTPQYWMNLQAMYDQRHATACAALSPEEQAAIAVSKAQAARGDFATDEEVRAVWAKHKL